jgi:dienelactone hydrolase
MKQVAKREIRIPVAGSGISLTGNLSVPEGADNIVIFSHGSGSSRHSPRNQNVALFLNKHNIATLLIDLLSQEEDSIYENRFNIELLTNRLVTVTEYVHRNPELKKLHIGYFGASTGAASAINAAARLEDITEAIVSRGGRPDLAVQGLPFVEAPTLFIIGGLDTDVIKLNKDAYNRLNCKKKMQIIDGASHLFEEPGKLDIVSELAADWFQLNLGITKRQNQKIKTPAL